MQFEVEQKFRLHNSVELETRLRNLGIESFAAVEQIDSYFAHPSRDFGATDEAFRLRRVGDANFITYKGPRVDATTKTRREMELPLSDGKEYAANFQEMLVSLGFRFVADVRKLRRTATVLWQKAGVEVAIDEVQSVGLYCELELIANKSEIDTAKALLASLAAELGLHDCELRSYLELLLGG